MPDRVEQPKKDIRKQPPAKDDKQAEELLREQSKTETEQGPYLDTEGGE
jgi:hypothetical protein